MISSHLIDFQERISLHLPYKTIYNLKYLNNILRCLYYLKTGPIRLKWVKNYFEFFIQSFKFIYYYYDYYHLLISVSMCRIKNYVIFKFSFNAICLLFINLAESILLHLTGSISLLNGDFE